MTSKSGDLPAPGQYHMPIKTFGEIADEATKEEIRNVKMKGRSDYHQSIMWRKTFELHGNVIAAGGLSDESIGRIRELYDELCCVNESIWDRIDRIMAFDLSVEHTDEEMRAVVKDAHLTQVENRDRTNIIRRINETAREGGNIQPKYYAQPECRVL